MRYRLYFHNTSSTDIHRSGIQVTLEKTKSFKSFDLKDFRDMFKLKSL